MCMMWISMWLVSTVFNLLTGFGLTWLVKPIASTLDTAHIPSKLYHLPMHGHVSIELNLFQCTMAFIWTRLLLSHKVKLIHNVDLFVNWCTSSLTSFTHDRLKHFDDGKHVCAIFFDLIPRHWIILIRRCTWVHSQTYDGTGMGIGDVCELRLAKTENVALFQGIKCLCKQFVVIIVLTFVDSFVRSKFCSNTSLPE